MPMWLRSQQHPQRSKAAKRNSTWGFGTYLNLINGVQGICRNATGGKQETVLAQQLGARPVDSDALRVMSHPAVAVEAIAGWLRLLQCSFVVGSKLRRKSTSKSSPLWSCPLPWVCRKGFGGSSMSCSVSYCGRSWPDCWVAKAAWSWKFSKTWFP